jgi:hypothetical protein
LNEDLIYNLRKKVKKNTADLATIAQEMTVKTDHNFIDNTARDTYFTAHAEELTEGLFIVVGTGFQKYINSTWVSVTSIISSFNDVMTDDGAVWEV